jgi:hypothetical protein
LSVARYTGGMPEDPPDPPASADVVLLAGPTEDGEGIRVVRARDERLEAGEVRPLKDGKPLGTGEIVRLAPRPGAPRVCDVEVVAKLGAGGASGRDVRGAGPPQVATSAYRESWERIFGLPNPPDEPNLLN